MTDNDAYIRIVNVSTGSGDIHVTVHSGDRVRALRRLLGRTGPSVGVHLKVDTGLGRLGFLVLVEVGADGLFDERLDRATEALGELL